MMEQLELDRIVAARGCMRWGRRSQTWRPGEEIFDPSLYGVEVIPGDTVARDFVVAHHYSGSYPAARCRAGLYLSRGPWMAPLLVGVAVFSVPMQQAVIPKYTGLAAGDGVELGRFILREEVPAPGETWFLARAMEIAREALGVRAVVSYSDPMPRRTERGEVVLPGHIGTIYQASNARYMGRSAPRTHWLDRRGRFLSQRALSKIRCEERGADAAMRRLAELGAPARERGESARDYVTRALREGPFRRVRHRGNHAYVFGLDRRMRRALDAGLPYPKERDDA